MIVKALMNLLYSVFSLLTSPINIPGMPDQVRTVLATLFDYIATGIAIASNYFDLNYLFILFGIVVAVDAGILIYKFVMWILKKIPMLGIQ